MNVCSGNFGDWSLSDGTINSAEWIIDSIDIFHDIAGHYSLCNSTNILQYESNYKKIEQVIDVLGRTTKNRKNQLLFYIYNDGTVEKRITITD